MLDVAETFVGWEMIQKSADGVPQAGNGAFCRTAKKPLQFAEQLLDGIEVWRIWRQIAELGTCIFDGRANATDFVGREIVQHHDVTKLQFGTGSR